MDALILLRHGKAVRDHEAPDDKSRGLTDRGRRQAAEAGAAIANAGLAPDRILVSSAARTRETYAALSSSFAASPAFLDQLYLATGKTIWNEAARSGGRVVLVIGHNPGLHDLGVKLADRAHDHSAAAVALRSNFPTSAFATFSPPDRATLISFWTPTR